MTPTPRPSRLKPDGLGPMRGYARRRHQRDGYVTPAGVLPSVTTLLAATSPTKSRLDDFLATDWGAAISDDAKRRGTRTHLSIEQWIEGTTTTPRTFNSILQQGLHGAYWRNIQPWLEAHFLEALAIETAIWHPAGYSGTFDCLGYAQTGSAPKALTLFDWKTAAKPREGDLLKDYFCQLAAYTAGLEYAFGVRPERALLVIARPHTNGPDIHELDAASLRHYEDAFFERVKHYYSMPDA